MGGSGEYLRLQENFLHSDLLAQLGHAACTPLVKLEPACPTAEALACGKKRRKMSDRRSGKSKLYVCNECSQHCKELKSGPEKFYDFAEHKKLHPS